MKKNYNADAIEVLSGLEPVKKHPGMFTDTSNPNHLAREVIDNSVDEALSGFASEIIVRLHEDCSLSVTDDGRGMPTDKNSKTGKSGVELILTTLHAGGKFSSNNYRYAGGLHGVGISVVNALSKTMVARARRNKREFTLICKNGKPVSPLKETGKASKNGSTIRFWPDDKYFEKTEFDPDVLAHLLRSKAALCPGLTTSLEVEGKKETLSWLYESGTKDYLREISKGQELLLEQDFCMDAEHEDAIFHLRLNWFVDNHAAAVESYVNLVRTEAGGSHALGVRCGLIESLREFISYNNMLTKGTRLLPEDLWGNIVGIISLKVENPTFAGQAKSSYTSHKIMRKLTTLVKDSFVIWLHENTQYAKIIVAAAASAAQARIRRTEKRSRKTALNSRMLPAKLADCTTTDINKNELFIVEGDSAGGSAKQARDRRYQAVLPLRGKILNAWECSLAEISASAEIRSIAAALGVSPGEDNLEGLRYGKICVLADADSDGMHIAVLLCALFVKFFKKLLLKGRLYIALPPLFRIDFKKQVYYARDIEERDLYLAKLSEKDRALARVLRFKGLGEMDAIQLRVSTMLGENRRLLRLSCASNGNEISKTTQDLMDMLLARGKAAERRQWLENKGHEARDLS